MPDVNQQGSKNFNPDDNAEAYLGSKEFSALIEQTMRSELPEGGRTPVDTERKLYDVMEKGGSAIEDIVNVQKGLYLAVVGDVVNEKGRKGPGGRQGGRGKSSEGGVQGGKREIAGEGGQKVKQVKKLSFPLSLEMLNRLVGNSTIFREGPGELDPTKSAVEHSIIEIHDIEELNTILEKGGAAGLKAMALISAMIKYSRKKHSDDEMIDFVDLAKVEYNFDISDILDDFTKYFELNYSSIGLMIAYQKSDENEAFFENLSSLEKVIARSIIMEANNTVLLVGDVDAKNAVKSRSAKSDDIQTLKNKIYNKSVWLGDANMRALLEEGREVLKEILRENGVLPDHLSGDDSFLERIFGEKVGVKFKYDILIGSVDNGVLEVLVNDERNIFPEVFIEELLGGRINSKRVDLLRNNIDNPNLTSDDLIALIMEEPKYSDSIPGVGYILRGETNLGEGGFGSVRPVLLILGQNLMVGVAKSLHTHGGKDFIKLVRMMELRGFNYVAEAFLNNKNNPDKKCLVQPYGIIELKDEYSEDMIFLMEGVFNKNQTALTLEDLLKSESSPEVFYAGVLSGIKAVNFLHNRGLIYGDFKPGNLFTGSNGVKLGDYSSVVTAKQYFKNGGLKIPRLPNYTLDVPVDELAEASGEATGYEKKYFWFGRLPNYDRAEAYSAFTAQYYDSEVYEVVSGKGEEAGKYAWKIDAVAIGKTIREMFTGRVFHFECDKDNKKGDEFSVVSGDVPQIFYDESNNVSLNEIANKLMDPHNLDYTLEDAIKDLELLLNIKHD